MCLVKEKDPVGGKSRPNKGGRKPAFHQKKLARVLRRK